jgi:hypothetical protein
MKLQRVSMVVLLMFVAVILAFIPVKAQEEVKSVQELTAQALKIKIGETTESEVISLLGQPSKISEGMKARRGGREIQDEKKVVYGPQNEIVVFINKSTSKVIKVNIKTLK